METKEEEILEKLWGILVEKNKPQVHRRRMGNRSLLNKLARASFIKISKDNISLTDKGYKESRTIIRRHRLAERLLNDVLSIEKNKIEEPSCKFEHVLSSNVEESICTLLGHPKECPHGREIPPGKCCIKNIDTVNKIVSSLNELKKGDSGKIVYILTKDNKKLQKLMALGVLPGKNIEVIQNFPSYVFQIRHTQIVIDKDMARDIYIMVTR